MYEKRHRGLQICHTLITQKVDRQKCVAYHMIRDENEEETSSWSESQPMLGNNFVYMCTVTAEFSPDVFILSLMILTFTLSNDFRIPEVVALVV